MIILLLLFLLTSNAFTLNRERSILFSRLVISGLGFAIYLAINNLHLNSLALQNTGIGIYGGLFHVTAFTQVFNVFILIISAIILTLTAFYPRKVYNKEYSSFHKLVSRLIFASRVENKKERFLSNEDFVSNKIGEQFRIIEYALIIVFILSGAIFLMSAGDLISIFLSIELQSYGLYIISTIYRDSESSTASGLTYFLLGGMSSCFILLGSALLYVNSGTTSLDNIYIIFSIATTASVNETQNSLMTLYQPYYFHLSFIIMFVGFLFKVSAAPFHFWSPDVYDGIPTIVTTYVAIIAKISIFVFLLEIIYFTESHIDSLSNFSFDAAPHHKNVLLLSSLFSLVIGSVLGLTQFRIKRLFAYSTISHVGFILLALSINSIESIQSYIFYLLQYSLANLNAFIILIAIGFSFYLYVLRSDKKDDLKEDLIDKNNSPIQLIDQIKGFFYINPFLAISLAVTIFSFIGIPPVIGFFAKQMILSAALDNGYIFMSFVAILTSVIGAAYYLNIIKIIFFYKDNYKINPSMENIVSNKSENIGLSSSFGISISVLTLLLLLFIYIPEEWFNIVTILTLIFFKG